MKFNWGTGIALFYTIFVLALVYQVYRSTQYDHSLVIDNYYEEDLKYQEHYDKLRNSQANALKVNYEAANKQLVLEFDEEMKLVQGEVLFFRPNDSSKDFVVKVDPNRQNRQVVATDKLLPGLWKVKIDWNGNGRPYYIEKVVVI